MEEKMYEFASCLVKGEDVICVYKNLEKILEENGLYHDLVGCKEKIWHLNGDDEKLKEMAKLYREREGNPDAAYIVNMLYLYKKDEKLYNELVSSINDKGCEGLNPGFDENTDKFSELWLIADRYCCLSHIVSFLFYKKKYDTILKIVPKFKELKQIKDDYIKNHLDCDTSDTEHMHEADKELSCLLSVISDNVEMNKLAISFLEDNKLAYLNIFKKYFENNKETEALDFFNEKYRKVFESDKISSYSELMWKISRIYHDCNDFYNSLRIKRLIFEYENKHISAGDEI